MTTFEELLDTLYGDDEESVVSSADALGALGNKKAVGPLIQCLRSPAAAIREACCAALGELGDSRAVAPLVSLLKDGDEDVQGEAFSALISIGQRRSEHLPHELLGGEDLSAPGAAATQIVWPADLEAIQILYSAAEDPNPEVRIGALYGLGQMALAGAVDLVAERFLGDSDLDVRAAAAFALTDLGERGVQNASEILIEGWRRGPCEGELAVNVMRGISTLATSDAFTALQEGLGHKDDRIRQLAALGLGRRNKADAVSYLTHALRDPHSGVKRMAASSLAALGDPRAIMPLIQTIPGESPEVRAAVAAALNRLPPHDFAAALDECVHSHDESLRAAAAFIMGRVNLDRGLSTLIRDPSGVVRKAAALALGNIGGQAHLQVLCGGLTDDEWSVRVACIEGLKRLGRIEAIEPLQSCAEDVHPVVRNAVRAALAALTGSNTV